MLLKMPESETVAQSPAESSTEIGCHAKHLPLIPQPAPASLTVITEKFFPKSDSLVSAQQLIKLVPLFAQPLLFLAS